MKKLLFLCSLIAIPNLIYAQQKKKATGPIIKDFGTVYQVENPDFKTDTNRVYRVVFDIYNSPDDPSMLNSQINTLARFLNMHAQAGVPKENLKVAGVLHNKASKDALNNETYKEKYGVKNPNIPLLNALEEAGVDIYMCGQSINARGLDRKRLAKPIQVGLSAMTIILSLQSEGYQLIKF